MTNNTEKGNLSDFSNYPKEVIFHVNTNGFIESGKITFIKDLLVQEHFNTGGINFPF